MTKETCKEGLQVARLDQNKLPPGMWVEWSENGACCWGCDGEGYRGWVDDSDPSAWAKAIDAAWAWYRRRTELARRMEALTDQRYREPAAEIWPDVLRWPDERVAQVEKELAEAESKVADKPPAPVRELSKPAPSTVVIELLEDLLARARTGYIRAIAYATVNTGRNVSTAFAVEEHGVEEHALVGGLERVKLRLLSRDEVARRGVVSCRRWYFGGLPPESAGAPACRQTCQTQPPRRRPQRQRARGGGVPGPRRRVVRVLRAEVPRPVRQPP